MSTWPPHGSRDSARLSAFFRALTICHSTAQDLASSQHDQQMASKNLAIIVLAIAVAVLGSLDYVSQQQRVVVDLTPIKIVTK